MPLAPCVEEKPNYYQMVVKYLGPSFAGTLLWPPVIFHVKRQIWHVVGGPYVLM